MENIKSKIEKAISGHFDPIIGEVTMHHGGFEYIVQMYGEFYFNNIGINKITTSITNEFRSYSRIKRWLDE